MRFAFLGFLMLAACVAARGSEFLYFPKLAEGVLAGDARAFRQVLAEAAITPPGEQLEELAELSSRFVRLAPAEFLQAQAATPTCFGISFMGAAYVDNPEAVARELDLRRKALESVGDPALYSVKARCLNELAGS